MSSYFQDVGAVIRLYLVICEYMRDGNASDKLFHGGIHDLEADNFVINCLAFKLNLQEGIHANTDTYRHNLVVYNI